MALLDWFPEILRLSMPYVHACVSVALPCGRSQVSKARSVSRNGVMTVSVSTLLAGRCGRNCLYLNSLSNQSLAKRSFRKVVLADSCRGSCLAMPSSSVSYHECVPNRACQEGRKSWLSLIVFRKSICACPCIIAPVVRSRPRRLFYRVNFDPLGRSMWP